MPLPDLAIDVSLADEDCLRNACSSLLDYEGCVRLLEPGEVVERRRLVELYVVELRRRGAADQQYAVAGHRCGESGTPVGVLFRADLGLERARQNQYEEYGDRRREGGGSGAHGGRQL